MRDILDDLFGNQPLDPTEAARRSMRPQLRKRFYSQATVGEGAPFPVLLDGRPVKTPAKNLLAAPARPLFAILLPSSAVTIEPASPGVFNRIEVVEPPYIAP